MKKQSREDHPRPCGEKLPFGISRSYLPGSPPPMRGKVREHGIVRRLQRITPAHAGKSRHVVYLAYAQEDHPRPCGEKHTNIVRGFFQRWITPAHAGKSAGIAGRMSGREDHPRPCGEKKDADVDKIREEGSPPPMRGKVNQIGNESFVTGITPAHAGKSHAPAYRALHVRDHPRPCGEKP